MVNDKNNPQTDQLEIFRQQLNQDFKQHIEILLERYSDQTKLLSEQHQDTTRRIQNLENKTDMVIETVADVKVEISEMNEGLGEKVDRKELVVLEHRLSHLEASL